MNLVRRAFFWSSPLIRNLRFIQGKCSGWGCFSKKAAGIHLLVVTPLASRFIRHFSILGGALHFSSVDAIYAWISCLPRNTQCHHGSIQLSGVLQTPPRNMKCWPDTYFGPFTGRLRSLLDMSQEERDPNFINWANWRWFLNLKGRSLDRLHAFQDIYTSWQKQKEGTTAPLSVSHLFKRHWDYFACRYGWHYYNSIGESQIAFRLWTKHARLNVPLWCLGTVSRVSFQAAASPTDMMHLYV